MKDKIYLTGFMTSGKSTLGKIIANVLGWNFFDLDKEIEKDEGKKVTKIFEESGEEYFRTVEKEKLKNLSTSIDTIISLGGGTLINDENLELIKNTGLLIYLRVNPDIIYTRIKKKTDRPLVKEFVLGDYSKEKFINKIKTMLDAREVYYKKADLIFEVDNSPIGLTVDRLAKVIRKYFNEKN